MTTGRRSPLSRLRGRSMGELRVRGAQAATILLERLGAGDLAEPRGDHLGALLQPGAAPEGAVGWCRAFRGRGGAGFHAGFNDVAATVERARAVDPAGTAAVLRLAERALEGRFDLLGFRDLSFGAPPDWHLDPVAGVRAPRAHWSRIAYLDPAVAGDHKVVWELNRHQWMVSLGQAWRLTGDARFAAAVARHLEDWMDANPPKVGINWASSLEIAFRAISWLWALRLLGDAPALPDATVLRSVGHLRLAARHLERNLSTYFSPNTHLTGEALGLYYLGHELRDLKGADRWRRTGRDILLRWLPTHVRPDGTYFEQSTWYHRYTLDFYLHFALLGRQVGDPVPDAVFDAIARLGEVVAHVARPDGSIPLIGDDDGGRLLVLDGRTQRDARPALANAGLATGRAFLCRLGSVTSESLWLFGPDAPERAGRLAGEATLPPPSRHFTDGGLVVMRSGWDAAASVLTVDAGPHGVMNCGHAHADALSLDLTVAGTPLFVDPGTRCYTADAGVRDRFRATASHNAATVDGADSSEMAGPFAWGRQAAARVDAWSPHETGDFLATGHDGFGGEYRREVLRIADASGDLWIVRDVFGAERDARLEAHFQCDTGLEVALADERRARVTREGRLVSTVIAAGGAMTVQGGEVSPLYGVSAPAPRLRVARHGTGALALCTVIGPALDDARCANTATGLTLVLSAGGREYVVLLGPGVEGAEGSLDVDARAFWGERGSGGGALRWWRAVQARRVTVNRSVVMESRDPRDAGWMAGVTPTNRT